MCSRYNTQLLGLLNDTVPILKAVIVRITFRGFWLGLGDPVF